jgi:hypothetical protein
MRTSYALLMVLAVLMGMGARCQAAVFNADVESAISKAKDYLYSKQKNGNWETAPAGMFKNDNSPAGGQWGGVTALVTYALLAAGESPQDAKISAAVDFLKKADIRGTYALSLRMQVWLLLPTNKEITALMRQDAQQMLAMTQSRGMARGMHDYTALGRGYSHSRSQYAVLGCWAAEQMIPEVIPTKYWALAEEGWLKHQAQNGGWSYMAIGESPHEVTPGMTAAGVATLYITQEFMHATEAADCRGNGRSAAIDAGVAWLTNNFDKVASDVRYSRDFPFLTLYAVERVGVAGGVKYFGATDWYDKGANWLLKVQGLDGSFVSAGNMAMDNLQGPVVDTSFATLFLVRGRAPVAINKLDYSGDVKKQVAWNQRPRDVANLMRWTAHALERDLNWQVVNLNVPPEELLDAPILYIAGSAPIVITDTQAAKLRAFVEMGGMIVGNADCNAAPFAASFRKLGQTLFNSYEFRELPRDHLIYAAPFKASTWKNKPQVQGLSNGARELMLLIYNGDPAKLWQTRAVKGREEAWQLPANIFLYACDQKDLRFKGESYLVSRERTIVPTRRLALARIQYADNWDPEPGGWRRLMAILNNRHDLDLQVDAVQLGAGKLAGYKIAHLTGTTRFTMNQASIDEMRQFVLGGGTLVIDAAGGAADFAESADAMLKAMFPDAAPTLLGAENPLYQLDGKPIAIEYRNYARKTRVGAAKTGRLMGVEVNKRLGVIMSREDLSAGLVGESVDGILGYSPKTATELMTAIVLSAAPKPPRTATLPAATRTTTAPATPGERTIPMKLR